MTTEEHLERIACELHELNATLNCRMDSFNDINENLNGIRRMLDGILMMHLRNL